MTNSVIEKSCQTYWKGAVLPSALYGAEVIEMKAEEIDKLQKESREHSNEKDPESSKVDCTSSNKRRDRNKQHEGENSKEQASLLKKDRNWK